MKYEKLFCNTVPFAWVLLGLLYCSPGLRGTIFSEKMAAFLKQNCNVNLLLNVIGEQQETTLKTTVHTETKSHNTSGPNRGDCTLIASHEGNFEAHDSSGREIHITHENNLKTRVEAFNSGIYFVTGTVGSRQVAKE